MKKIFILISAFFTILFLFFSFVFIGCNIEEKEVPVGPGNGVLVNLFVDSTKVRIESSNGANLKLGDMDPSFRIFDLLAPLTQVNGKIFIEIYTDGKIEDIKNFTYLAFALECSGGKTRGFKLFGEQTIQGKVAQLLIGKYTYLTVALGEFKFVANVAKRPITIITQTPISRAVFEVIPGNNLLLVKNGGFFQNYSIQTDIAENNKKIITIKSVEFINTPNSSAPTANLIKQHIMLDDNAVSIYDGEKKTTYKLTSEQKHKARIILENLNPPDNKKNTAWGNLKNR